MFDRLKAQFPSEELTPGVRILATLMLLINLPLFVIGMFAFMFIVPLPGLFFYIYTILVARGKAARTTAISVTSIAILYNGALIGAMFADEMVSLTELTSQFWAMLAFAITLGFSLMSLRMLLEKEREARKRIVEVHEAPIKEAETKPER